MEPKMSKAEARELVETMQYIGIAPTFMSDNQWRSIKDEEFHRLRNEFIKACNELNLYILGAYNQ